MLTQKSKKEVSRIVYVLNNDGHPLMSCSAARARHLLKANEAIVVGQEPFTIRLIVGIKNPVVQKVVLGLDTGAKNIGVSAVSQNRVLYQAKIELRDNIRKKMDRRRMFRKNKRSRKCRYRALRFNNRSRKDNWLSPSVKSKVDSMIKVVNLITDILPISGINVELVNFDTQAIKQNTEKLLAGWMYQRGPLYEEENIKSYIRSLYHYICVYCKKPGDETDHIVPYSKGGTTTVDNLVCACHKCNQDKGNRTAEEFGYPRVQQRVKKSLKAAAHTQMAKTELVKQLRDIAPVKITYGHITKVNRKALGLPKSHSIDAVVIASEGTPVQIPQVEWRGRSIPRGNYRLYKGAHSHIKNQSARILFGFKQWDKVRLPDNQVGFIKGKRSTGYFCVSDIEGNVLNPSINYRCLQLLRKSSGIIWIENKRDSVSSPQINLGVSDAGDC